jgi:hypothetical protein
MNALCIIFVFVTPCYNFTEYSIAPCAPLNLQLRHDRRNAFPHDNLGPATSSPSKPCIGSSGLSLSSSAIPGPSFETLYFAAYPSYVQTCQLQMMMTQEIFGRTNLLPHRGPAAQAFACVLLRFCLVALDDSAVKLGLIHVVYSFSSIFGQGELYIAKASMWIV